MAHAIATSDQLRTQIAQAQRTHDETVQLTGQLEAGEHPTRSSRFRTREECLKSTGWQKNLDVSSFFRRNAGLQIPPLTGGSCEGASPLVALGGNASKPEMVRVNIDMPRDFLWNEICAPKACNSPNEDKKDSSRRTQWPVGVLPVASTLVEQDAPVPVGLDEQAGALQMQPEVGNAPNEQEQDAPVPVGLEDQEPVLSDRAGGTTNEQESLGRFEEAQAVSAQSEHEDTGNSSNEQDKVNGSRNEQEGTSFEDAHAVHSPNEQDKPVRSTNEAESMSSFEETLCRTRPCGA